MATVCVKILPHHLKADGTYNVKIRITHKMVKRYIDTEHFVTQKQLTKKLTLKDPFTEQQLQAQLIKYRQEISKLDEKLEFMNADQIRDHLVGKDEAIDFIKFCDDHIKRLKKRRSRRHRVESADRSQQPGRLFSASKSIGHGHYLIHADQLRTILTRRAGTHSE